jgi:hypothetical protein
MAKSMRVNRNKRYSKKRRTNNKATNRKSARREKKRNSRRNNRRNLRGGMNKGAGGDETAEKPAGALGPAVAAVEAPAPAPAPAAADGAPTAANAAANAGASGEAAAPPAADGAANARQPKGTGTEGAVAAPPGEEQTEPAGTVTNPMYGKVNKTSVQGIYVGVEDDEEIKDAFRIGIIVSLDYLIRQLELVPESERLEDGIKAAAEDVLEHLKIIDDYLKSDEPGAYGNELYKRLVDALNKLQEYQSSGNQDQYTDTLPTLREAFVIFKVLDQSIYGTDSKLQKPKSEFGEKLSAEQLNYGTRKGVSEADYLKIYAARKEEDAIKKAEARLAFLRKAKGLVTSTTPTSTTSTTSTNSEPLYVKVTPKVTPKGGKIFEAEVVEWKYPVTGPKLN